MTDTTTKTVVPDTTTLVPPATAKAVKAPKAKVTKAPAEPKSAEPPVRANHPIVRTIPAGSRIDPNAVVTVQVANPKIGVKNYARWKAGYPRLGESAKVKDILAVPGGPTVGDLRYDHERAFITIDPAPAAATKK